MTAETGRPSAARALQGFLVMGGGHIHRQPQGSDAMGGGVAHILHGVVELVDTYPKHPKASTPPEHHGLMAQIPVGNRVGRLRGCLVSGRFSRSGRGDC